MNRIHYITEISETPFLKITMYGGMKNTCSGDSGGGLIIPKSSGNKTAIVIGIVSFVMEDCLNSFHGRPVPSVFTKVSNYYDWIKFRMEKDFFTPCKCQSSLELELSFILLYATLVAQVVSFCKSAG